MKNFNENVPEHIHAANSFKASRRALCVPCIGSSRVVSKATLRAVLVHVCCARCTIHAHSCVELKETILYRSVQRSRKSSRLQRSSQLDSSSVKVCARLKRRRREQVDRRSQEEGVCAPCAIVCVRAPDSTSLSTTTDVSRPRAQRPAAAAVAKERKKLITLAWEQQRTESDEESEEQPHQAELSTTICIREDRERKEKAAATEQQTRKSVRTKVRDYGSSRAAVIVCVSQYLISSGVRDASCVYTTISCLIFNEKSSQRSIHEQQQQQQQYSCNVQYMLYARKRVAYIMNRSGRSLAHIIYIYTSRRPIPYVYIVTITRRLAKLCGRIERTHTHTNDAAIYNIIMAECKVYACIVPARRSTSRLIYIDRLFYMHWLLMLYLHYIIK
ncbi:unnamed protein product [Trichogramma brassicae]|uniref:Uncharacterized protein n=1 Tax=Trichogramma brassicae TaxID=86971 RepID=A0A6H5I9V9_9HYME|nr:unnamed protein product [Trichogramma brassicae]